MSGLFDELKRRNVVRVGVAYVLLAWLIAQVAELALDSFEAPGWVIKAVLLLLTLGLPVALFFAWAFEITPEGLKKEKDVDRSQSITHDTGRKLNTLIISVLVIAVGMLLFDKFLPRSENIDPVAESTAAETNSVAVLPFVDMSAAQDQEYFTDGLTENLLHALAQIRELKVAGRTSSFAFKGLNTDLRDIGQQLNVGSILEGSVQKSGDRIRITTQLINAEDGYHLWSETFDRDLTDIFKVQDEIAEAVAVALRKSLLGDVTASNSTTENFEAYNAYLLGLSNLNKRTTDDWDKAIEQFQLAVEIDPGMALAWAGLSRAYSIKTSFGSDFAEGYQRARSTAERAIALDPDLADGYLALGTVQTSYDWDWEGAEESLHRAVQLRPGDPDIISNLAWLKGIRGDSLGAFEDIETALSQDPLNYGLARTHIGMLSRLGRDDEALKKAEFLAQATPDSGGVHYALATALLRVGDLQQALLEADKEIFPFLRWEMLARISWLTGDIDAAQAYLDELTTTYGDDVSWQVASVYATWGDKDEALAALERGFAARDPGLIYVRSARLFVDLFEGDPRFDAFLKKMNLL